MKKPLPLLQKSHLLRILLAVPLFFVLAGLYDIPLPGSILPQVPQAHAATSLTLYASSAAASTITTANKFYTTSGTPSTTNKSTTVNTSTGWVELLSHGGMGTFSSTLQTPSGHGFLLDSTMLEGNDLLAGNWSGSTNLAVSTGNLTATALYRFYKYNGGTYSTLGSLSLTSTVINTTFTTHNFANTAFPLMHFSTGDKLYMDMWLHITANSTGSGSTVKVGKLSTDGTNHTGSANQSFTTAGYQDPAVIPLTAYGSTASSGTLSTANQLYQTSGTPSVSSSTTTFNSVVIPEILSQGGTDSQSYGGTADGKGFLLDSSMLEGQQIVGGTWTGTVNLAVNSGSINASLSCDFFKYSNGSYQSIVSAVSSSVNITTTAANITCSGSTSSPMVFYVGQKLYIDLILTVASNSGASSVTMSDLSTDTSGQTGNSNNAFVTPGYQLAPGLPLLHTSGRQILDQYNSVMPFLQGANRFSLDYSCTGDTHFGVSDFEAMRDYWKINIVRIGISEAFWKQYGTTCSNYITTVTSAINNAESVGLYVDLDLHYVTPLYQDSSNCESDMGNGGEDFPLPGTEANAFWTSVAQTYANNTGILFGLYNEPHDMGSSTWSTWQMGGTVTIPYYQQCAGKSYTGLGMQQIITNDINPYAPNVPVIASGVLWGYDLSCTVGSNYNGCTSSGYPLSVQSSIIYNEHMYNNDATAEQPNWNQYVDYAANEEPVIVDEFGGNASTGANECPYIYDMLNNAKTVVGTGSSGTLLMGAMAWVWDASGNQSMGLLQTNDWSGKNASTYGQYIKDYYNNVPDSSCESSSTTSLTYGSSSVSANPVSLGSTININTQVTNQGTEDFYVVFSITDASNNNQIDTPAWNALILAGGSQETITLPYYISSGLYTSGHTYNVSVTYYYPGGNPHPAGVNINATSFTVS